MSKPIRIGLALARMPHILVVSIVLVGWTFNTGGQTLTTLWNFAGNGTNGINPAAPLAQGSDGNFYGTVYNGGTSTNCSSGCGAVFRISAGGAFTNLYQFTGSATDGSNPWAGLVQGSDGNFYGVAESGGAYQFGTVFRMSPAGGLTNLHSFTGGGSDGGHPDGVLVQGSDSNFYGTTSGSRGGPSGAGTVFRISPSGTFTNLHAFAGSDGISPYAGLARGRDGNFYGTTFGTEASSLNAGTVFQITPTGIFTNLHFFAGIDGFRPYATLIQGSDGNFYGTTLYGGPEFYAAIGDGVVFQISPGGTFSNLYSFSGGDGADPHAGLVQGSDGNFYGTTQYGGAYGSGTVFRISVPLNPSANQISAVQFAGTNIVFAIPSVESETYQLQFSSSLTPTNWINVPGVSASNCIGALLTLTNFGGSRGTARGLSIRHYAIGVREIDRRSHSTRAGLSTGTLRMRAKVHSAAVLGIDSYPIEIEVNAG